MTDETDELLAGRYEIGEPLGAGGMARVVLARDTLLGRTVAVKLLDTAASADMRERFLGEARAAASLSHPNAITVHDLGEDGRRAYMVMEVLEGGSLADVLEERGALDVGEAVRVIADVLSALEAAHRRNIVHRDIKPANILLDRDGRVVLSDFGIAKSIADAAGGLTAAGQIMGTPAYLSPEQVSGRPANERSDVYAAGVVLYECLTGRPPFSGDNSIAVALAHQTEPVPPIDRRDVDTRLRKTVERALAKDPDKRWPSAAAMRDALLGAAPGAATAATTQLLPRRASAAATQVLPRDTAPPAREAGRPRAGARPPRPSGQRPAPAPRQRFPWLVAAAVMVLAALVYGAFALATAGTDPDDSATPEATAPTVEEPAQEPAQEEPQEQVDEEPAEPAQPTPDQDEEPAPDQPQEPDDEAPAEPAQPGPDAGDGS